ncbi:peptidylprolyl isomerase [Paenibacillus sambharensis]|uniref:Peptidylprolyl isomerase n=1 Tax=Paenibacillus sambharensis TaxID=1803190 RepID=A0A2W1LIY3_9BACL|nr:peptidylprolyl isomerase [Paenibacillus sambharensis]PZD94865.1 peptidylprolyl isomerase [Paenibacillus sambharensis]
MLFNKRKSSWRQGLLLVVAALLVLTMAAGCGKKDNTNTTGGGNTPAAEETDATIVATYKDGGQVTETEFNKYIALQQMTDPQNAMYLMIPQYKEQELKRYIVYKEYEKKATEEQLKTAEEQAGTFRKNIEDALKENEELKKTMSDSGLTVDEAVNVAKTMLAASAVIEAKRVEFAEGITEEDLEAAFKEKQADYTVATVRHILVGTMDPATGEQSRTEEEALSRAIEVKEKLEKGGDWGELAKVYSDDTGSKENGGLYEEQQVNSWVEEFKNAAITQEIGVIGDPVKTTYGYHVMKVEKREEVTFDKLTQEQKDQLRESIAVEKLNEFMTQEQEQLEIKVTLPQEEPAPADAGNAATEGNAGTDASGNAGAEGEQATEGNAATEGNTAE